MNDGVAVTLAGESLIARASGALWWPDRRLLAVADLHLGKAERGARRAGGMLPPYADHDTLMRLGAEVEALDPAVVVVVGDAFDDRVAAANPPRATLDALGSLASGRALVWIAGNHDPLPVAAPGESMDVLSVGAVTFRHIASGAVAEISGHYHPKAILKGRGRRIARRCFVVDASRLILPAFGTFTGGLDVAGPVMRALITRDAVVVLTGRHVRAMAYGALLP